MEVSKGKELLIYFSLALVILSMTACSLAKTQDSNLQSAPVDSYGIQQEMILDLGNNALSNCCLTEQFIYFEKMNEATAGGLCRQNLAEDAEAVEVLKLERNEVLQRFAITDEGEVIGAVKCYELTENDEVDYNAFIALELRKFTETGSLLWKKEIPEGQTMSIVTHILVGSAGNICIASGQELLFFEKSGDFIKRQSVKGEMIQLLADMGEENIAVLQNTQTRQGLTVYQGTTGKELYHKEFQDNRRWFGGAGRLYSIKEDLLVKYDWKNNTEQAIINFTDCGIDVSAIEIFKELGDESFLVGLKEEGNSKIRFVLLSDEVQQEEICKTQLILASINPQTFQSSVVSFNTRDTEYELIQKSYDISQLDQFNAYLATQNSADVVEIPGKHLYSTYVEDDYLMDLLPLIEQSEKINLEDFLPRAIDEFMVDGKFYSVPRGISVAILACSTELLDGKTSWTIEEYLDFMEEYPNAFSAEGYAEEVVKGKIFRTAMYLGIEAFIDEETGIATFGSERFRSILKRISALDVSVIPQSREERAKNGEVVLWDLDFFKTENLLSAEQKNGKELTLIGYPGSGLEEGHKSGGLIGYTDLIGIHRATKHVDGAWTYVESYIAGGLKKGDFYFPTGKDAFEEKLQEGIDKQNPEITQVHVEKVRSAFQEGVYLGDEEYDLLSILDEEVIPYFKGDKELDDVVKIIQNRIQLYLDEK